MDGKKSPHHIFVLGAGLCGLYAGRVLSKSEANVTVLEKENVLGGLVGGQKIKNNSYELGVHHLHMSDREIFEDIQFMMGNNLIPTKKIGLIRFGSGYRRYPLKFHDLLLGIPLWTLFLSIVEFIIQQVRNKFDPHEPQNAEQALIELYGRHLYKLFFRDFTHRYWGIHPQNLSPIFISQKMPRLSAIDFLKKAISQIGLRKTTTKAVERALTEETLYYAKTGAQEIPQCLAHDIKKEGNDIFLSSPVERIFTKNNYITAIQYRSHGKLMVQSADFCISTIPLSSFVHMFDPPPPEEVLISSRQLKYLPIAVYGFLVQKPKLLNALYYYFLNKIFHRIGEPKNSGMEVKPNDHTILLVETTCVLGDDLWNGSSHVIQQIIKELEEEKILNKDDIVETHQLKTQYGYPVFDLGFESHLNKVLEFLSNFKNLKTTGRQGSFCYPNMHLAMRMGANAAEEILKM